MKKNYFGDIQNKIYEEGKLKENEKVIDIIEGCLLLERFTGKYYSYRLMKPSSLEAKYLYSRLKPINKSHYENIKKKIYELSYNTELSLSKMDNYERAKKLVITVFRDILPQHGLSYRESQEKLALNILESLFYPSVLLAEAEVGTGKTHTYIVATIIYNLFLEQKYSTVISTSTVALQKALIQNYIPNISKILIEHQIIDKPIFYTVKKGKKRYICELELLRIVNSKQHKDRDKSQIELLETIKDKGNIIDVDELTLNNYFKDKIRVKECKHKCVRKDICRYKQLQSREEQQFFDFYVTNHNFFISVSKNKNIKSLFSNYNVVIFDEGHKIPQVLNDMYSNKLSLETLNNLSKEIKTIRLDEKEKHYIDILLEKGNRLFESFSKRIVATDKNYLPMLYTEFELQILYEMILSCNKLIYKFSSYNKDNNLYYKSKLENISLVLSDILKRDSYFSQVVKTQHNKCEIVCIEKDIGKYFCKEIMEKDKNYIITSGTLSVNGDFKNFKKAIGIVETEKQIKEIKQSSPFSYIDNGLIYLPNHLPLPNIRDETYVSSIVKEITKLIYCTKGHTLLLFTSYNFMKKIFLKMEKRIKEYPLFMLDKQNFKVIESFKNSKNGVLFASDVAGEGIDFSGDIVSSLIIVKLPFPIPNFKDKYEIKRIDKFQRYLEEIIIPNMILKLRQWIGRGIRQIDDTCVFSILDTRASYRYRDNILRSIPNMRVTQEISDIEEFILNRKGNNYFE